MTLVLEIEYLSGVCFAAIGPESGVPDWPPQPDRIFSALVATWAARGEDRDETKALEWLEALPPPLLRSSDARARTAPLVFVPPNDARSDKGKHAKGVLPPLRSRQPRRFPAARPADPIIRLVWGEAPPSDAVFAALQRLAHDTAYVGHSTSLTRCLFRHDDALAGAEHPPAPPRRRIYRGRLAELRQRYKIFAATGESKQRPRAGAPMIPLPPPAGAAVGTGVFAERWLVLEDAGPEMPDLRACALVAKAIRDTLLSGYQQIGLAEAIPEVVSGHAADRSPARAPHLAIVPLPFVGFPYADGHVIGFALVPPRAGDLLADETFRRAMRAVAPADKEDARRVMKVWRQEEALATRFELGLSPTLEAGKLSLESRLYTDPARTFATVTPIVLDRHLKQRGAARDDEIRVQIAAACGNIGLPEPDQIVADKHSAFEGAPSAEPSGSSPAWMRWRLPAPLASRQLTHAIVRFAQPVAGPVLLGAGRFVGLGLCRPLDAKAR